MCIRKIACLLLILTAPIFTLKNFNNAMLNLNKLMDKIRLAKIFQFF